MRVCPFFSVKGKKTDEDGNALGGAVIGIFKVGTEKYTEKTAIQTATSAEDGSFGCNYSVLLRNPQFLHKVEKRKRAEKNQRNVNIQEAKKVVC